MSLAPGARLGVYEVISAIGEGGMGEVYRARDPRLDRNVAIKVLPDAFAADPERLRRFEQEARAAAALNHPNILAVYDIGQHKGSIYLVSEILEGRTLREQLRDGVVSVRTTIDVAVQIAHGLAAAHDKGIVHRDIKPENIFLTADRRVKILDFGLAKLTHAGAALAGGASAVPTVGPETLPGIVLGTVGYMSPEQVRGQKADARSDLFALGATLYEMLTGRRAFRGQTPADTMTAILREEPPELTTAAPELAPALGRIVHRCLEKDPSARFQSAADLAFALDGLTAASGPIPAMSVRLRANREMLAWGVAAIFGVAMIALVLWRPSPANVEAPETAAPVVGATIKLPTHAPLALGAQIPRIGIDSPAVALSPDGRRLAYIAQTPTGTAVYTRDLSGGEFRAVAGTEGAIHAFFSPDSRWLGFLTNDKVNKVPLSGGTPVALCDARVPIRAIWAADDQIYFDEDQGFRVSRVPAEGGAPSAVKVPPFVMLSHALPGGDLIATDYGGVGINRDYANVVLITANGEKTVLVRSGYDGRFVAPGYLLFGRGGNLYGVRFDLATRAAAGEATLVAAGVSMDSLFSVLHASISEGGVLAYVPGTNRSIGRLAWVDRRGTTEFVDTAPRLYGVLDLTDAGDRVAVHVGDVTDHVWVYDFARHEGRRLAASQNAGWPIWTPDGASLTFTTWISPRLTTGVATQAADRPGSSEQLVSGESDYIFVDSWSPDRRVLTATLVGTGLRRAVIGADGRINRVATSNVEQWGSSFSPDGRWLAYSSNETGQFEVYVESFPDRTVVRQISVEGGAEPRWCRCGELFYRNGNRWFATTIRTTPDLGWDTPRLAFDTDFIDTPGISYDVSPDGRRLLVVKRANPEGRDSIGVIANWTAVLRPDGAR